MMFTKTFGIAAVFATLASALPSGMVVRQATADSGSVLITNTLNKDIYAWSVSQNVGPMQTIKAGGGTYSEKWQTNPNGGGISIKMSTTETRDSVLQFEYTLDSDKLYWDLSSIDMDASSEFVKNGFAAIPSDSSCSTATCEAGDSNCAESYQHPDDVNTLSCSTDAQYVLTLG